MRSPPMQRKARGLKAARAYVKITWDSPREMPPDARLLRPECARRRRPPLPFIFLAFSALHARFTGASCGPARGLVARPSSGRRRGLDSCLPDRQIGLDPDIDGGACGAMLQRILECHHK